jgi:uncharacterized membrane protein/protein-disulfide isomerase
MARAAVSSNPGPSHAVIAWLTAAAAAGLAFASASTWVHSRILRDPFYSSSICDVSTFFSCTEAYTSRFGSVGGIPVALVGVVYFAFLLGLIVLCQRSPSARQNLPGYVFVASTVGLAGALYLAYASLFVLKAVCLLCVGTYVSIVALFVVSGTAERYPMSTLPSRASRDMRTLVHTPAALVSTIAFAVAAVAAVMMFPGGAVSAAAGASEPAAAAEAQAARPLEQLTPEMLRELDQYLSAQSRVQIAGTGGTGAAVVIVKFNDYQCPPCGMTYREYKPVLARLQAQHPGKIAFMTKDFPLDPECNPMPTLVGGGHASACEAAAAVRLAREKGRADAMEEWLFANQSTLTPQGVQAAVSSIAGVTDFAARYPKILEPVRSDITQGLQVGVTGTPTFFLNGIRLQNWPPAVFQAAIEWELRRAASK